jgi:hypothetical protein
MSCKVYGCRFSDTHTTAAHLCGKCQTYGHGMKECGNWSLLDTLKPFLVDTLPDDTHCQFETCNHPQTHTTGAHHCGHCRQRHGELQCPQRANFWLVKCPVCRIHNTVEKETVSLSVDLETSPPCCVMCQGDDQAIIFPTCKHRVCCKSCAEQLNRDYDHDAYLQTVEIVEPCTRPCSSIVSQDPDGLPVPQLLIDLAHRKFAGCAQPVYCVINAGMGCVWFVKKTTPTAPVEVFFLHSDNLGQYGDSHIPQMQQFITGCVQVSTNINELVTH